MQRGTQYGTEISTSSRIGYSIIIGGVREIIAERDLPWQHILSL